MSPKARKKAMARQRSGHTPVHKDSATEAVIARRKRVAHDVVTKYGRPVAWLGGVLYFTDSPVPEEVPGTPVLLKPGSSSATHGLTVAQPQPRARPAYLTAWRPSTRQ